MNEDSTVVLTAKTIDRILGEGGSSSWRLDRNRARQLPYIVCCRNAHADWSKGPELHRAAFLVGKVRDVVPCPATPENNEADLHRYLIQFSEYALVDIPDAWEKGRRNPVGYSSMARLGIDPERLSWETMPAPSFVPLPPSKEDDEADFQSAAGRPLTMAEAKKGLALTFNVPASSIEITIRG